MVSTLLTLLAILVTAQGQAEDDAQQPILEERKDLMCRPAKYGL